MSSQLLTARASIRVSMALLFTAFGMLGGCDKAKPYRDAQAMFGEDLALVAAYAAFVRTPGKTMLEREAAYVAAAKLVPIGERAKRVNVEKLDILAPTALARAALDGLPLFCGHPLDSDAESFEKMRKSCIQGLDLIDGWLASTEQSAVAAGLPKGSFPRLADGVTASARDKAALLSLAIELTADEKAFAALKADPTSKYEGLSAACAKARASLVPSIQSGDSQVDELQSMHVKIMNAECLSLIKYEALNGAVEHCTAAKNPSECYRSGAACTILALDAPIEPPAAFAALSAQLQQACKK